ncbi:MAG: iron-sulfur cluster assembly scaffold protein [Candidatus Mcinerneyibacterium aminivorans]|jgi:NifU-like protein involved in Fe-S cluster formation/bacterioferritin-associated ferredoxin|uniref:Iron-sulfur cluster assembly scaffold protein n=1 Tax=Candidatus Mcinerneyibacterium aminivorans TaxID=2703815 RepID=A0A5D0MBT7_9BACT|nr:MAG: iron-sulfur cluster assembly scaffold protein [Candidatus Mcinerneyibacterium aminivorans]
MSDDLWVYSDKVKNHFTNPKNILEVDEKEYDYDGKGQVGSPACGDMMVVYIKVENQKIKDFKWKTFGCASAIASTSVLSEMVTRNGGMSLEKAYEITPEQIIENLEGLPANKIHCSVLGDKALRAAIDDYFKKQEKKNPYKDEDVEIVCECFNISKEDIRMEVLEGATNFSILQARTKIGTQCGKCIDKTKKLLKEYVDKYYKEKIYNPEKD